MSVQCLKLTCISNCRKYILNKLIYFGKCDDLLDTHSIDPALKNEGDIISTLILMIKAIKI